LHNIRKSFLCAFLTFILVKGLVLVTIANIGIANAGTEVSWILSSDTTWTKANGPYILTGNVLVETDVTLTVEADTILNLNEYFIRVNGTMIIQPGVTINTELEDTIIEVYGVLDARGTSTNPIYIKGSIYHYSPFAPVGPLRSGIRFYESSIGWDEQTQSGCIMENVIFTSTVVGVRSTVKITGNSFFDYSSVHVSGGSSEVSHNSFNDNSGASVSGGSPEVSHNSFGGHSEFSVSDGSPNVLHNKFDDSSVSASGGSPAFSDNTIDGIISVDEGSPTFSNNIINGPIRITGSPSTTIINNQISNGYIFCGGGIVSIIGNVLRQALLDTYLQYKSVITDSNTAIWVDQGRENGGPVIIENNLITDCDVAIDVLSTNSGGTTESLTIKNNSIRNNLVGIIIKNNVTPIISYNNIYDNSINIKLAYPQSIDIDASSNWWGTTDTQAINQTIHDYKYEFDLGRVDFVPFLTEPNSEAASTIPEFPSWIILPMFLFGTIVCIIYRNRLRKKSAS
jgi:hypothetical protein